MRPALSIRIVDGQVRRMDFFRLDAAAAACVAFHEGRRKSRMRTNMFLPQVVLRYSFV